MLSPPLCLRRAMVETGPPPTPYRLATYARAMEGGEGPDLTLRIDLKNSPPDRSADRCLRLPSSHPHSLLHPMWGSGPSQILRIRDGPLGWALDQTGLMPATRKDARPGDREPVRRPAERLHRLDVAR